MTISALPTVPNRSMASDVFTSTTDAFLAALPTFATEANALAVGLNAIAAGTSVGIQYAFSTTITDSDPGNGILRLSSATQNTSTVIRADLLDSASTDWSSVLATLADSTSAIKGHVLLEKSSDATKWILFAITSMASPAGYKNITATVVGSSSANPFLNGDSLFFKFTRNGDKGDTGATGTGITTDAVGWHATGGTVPHTLTVDVDLTTSNVVNGVYTSAFIKANTAQISYIFNGGL